MTGITPNRDRKRDHFWDIIFEAGINQGKNKLFEDEKISDFELDMQIKEGAKDIGWMLGLKESS
jgi:hypothetical protein